MKKSKVKIGGVYAAKVTNKGVQVWIDAESRYGGWEATNLTTGKKVRIESPTRLRAAVGGDSAATGAKKAKGGKKAKAWPEAAQSQTEPPRRGTIPPSAPNSIGPRGPRRSKSPPRSTPLFPAWLHPSAGRRRRERCFPWLFGALGLPRPAVPIIPAPHCCTRPKGVARAFHIDPLSRSPAQVPFDRDGQAVRLRGFQDHAPLGNRGGSRTSHSGRGAEDDAIQPVPRAADGLRHGGGTDVAKPPCQPIDQFPADADHFQSVRRQSHNARAGLVGNHEPDLRRVNAGGPERLFRDGSHRPRRRIADPHAVE